MNAVRYQRELYLARMRRLQQRAEERKGVGIYVKSTCVCFSLSSRGRARHMILHMILNALDAR